MTKSFLVVLCFVFLASAVFAETLTLPAPMASKPKKLRLRYASKDNLLIIKLEKDGRPFDFFIKKDQLDLVVFYKPKDKTVKDRLDVIFHRHGFKRAPIGETYPRSLLTNLINELPFKALSFEDVYALVNPKTLVGAGIFHREDRNQTFVTLDFSDGKSVYLSIKDKEVDEAESQLENLF